MQAEQAAHVLGWALQRTVAHSTADQTLRPRVACCQDVAELEARLGRKLEKAERARIGVGQLRRFLEHLLQVGALGWLAKRIRGPRQLLGSCGSLHDRKGWTCSAAIFPWHLLCMPTFAASSRAKLPLAPPSMRPAAAVPGERANHCAGAGEGVPQCQQAAGGDAGRAA